MTNDSQMLEEAQADQDIQHFFSTQVAPSNYMKALSSRQSEAASVGTPQLLLEGPYRDVLVPNQRDVSTRHNLGNLDTAHAQLVDVGERVRIVDAARSHVAQDHALDPRIDSILVSFTKARH